MTRPEISKAALGVLTTILTLVLVATWATKVSRADFNMHVQDVRNYRTNHALSDSAWRQEQRELTLELLCEVKPQSRKCR